MDKRQSFANILMSASRKYNPLGTSATQNLAKSAQVLSQRVYPITAPGVKKLYKNIFGKDKKKFSDQDINLLEFAMILRTLSYGVEDVGNIVKKFIQFNELSPKEQEADLLEFITDTAAEIKDRLESLGRSCKVTEDALKEPLALRNRMEMVKKEAYSKI